MTKTAKKPAKKAPKATAAAKRERFCHEFMVDLVATKAAIRAGFAEHTARQAGSELLSRPDIRARIAELMEIRSKHTMVHAEFVVNSLLENVARCQQKVPVMEFDPVEKRMKQKMQQDEHGLEVGVWEFDSNGANKALELLGRHLAMFTDKLKTTAVVEQPLFPDAK